MISQKPYKQWCKARGLDFYEHIQKYPRLAKHFGIVAKAKPVSIARIPWWRKLWRWLQG